MSKEPFFKDLSPFAQITIFLAVVLGFLFLFSLLSVFLTSVIYGFSLDEIQSLSSHLDKPKAISALKFMQAVSQIGIFVLPPLVFVSITQQMSLQRYFKFNKVKNPSTYLWATIGVFTIIPFIGVLTSWNMQMELPGSLEGLENWMKTSEESASQIMKAFLNVSTLSGLWINIFIIAVLPAVGEELLFRGGIQQVLSKSGLNKHLAIIVTALVFSAFHMQFYGFLPRFVLGLMLGYAFVLSNSLWIPVLMHFVNNAFSVVVSYFYYNGMLDVNYDQIGLTEKLIPVMLSVVLTIYVLLRIGMNENTLEREKNKKSP